MKNKVLLSVVMALAVLLGSGCSKEESRYYVRYDVVVSSQYSGDYTYITVRDEKGKNVDFVTADKTFTETFGPVGKNFEANMKTYVNCHMASVTQNIYVCKGDEPFALKATKTSNTPAEDSPAELSYTIDF